MLEPPDLEDELIVAALEAAYGLEIGALAFLPVGNDARTWVYRVEAVDGDCYFLKVRAGEGFGVASLASPHALREGGVAHVLAPLATREGAQWVSVDGFKLALYPFVEGRMGADGGLTQEQWTAFGALMRQVHAFRLPEAVVKHVPRETFVPAERALIEQLDEATAGREFATEEARAFAAIWRKQRARIGEVTARVDQLGAKLREAGLEQVLCHGDMHPWNVLVEADGTWWLVDWDEVMMAPKERDLMFAVGGIGGDGVGAAQTAAFLEGYGEEEISARALVYYRAAWAVQDIAAYGRDLFFTPRLGEVSRRASLAGFESLLGEGRIVGIAVGG